jgi:hypothetical protein
MTHREDVNALCVEGISPVQISERLRISVSDVRTHLLALVGEGRLRRSDILFSIPAQDRQALQDFVDAHPGQAYWDICNAGRSAGLDQETLRLFISLSHDDVWRGDLYEYIAEIEIRLHALVKSTLANHFGTDELGWWRKGVSESIRKSCVTAREGDDEPVADPFAYTNFIHLKDILDDHWGLFRDVLPELRASNRKQLFANLGRLNKIRNRVMHPVKGGDVRDTDFLFVREFLRVGFPRG